MAYTLLLNDKWDIHVDDAGNIATAVDDYAIAQNVANAVRLFENDAYFERARGVPYLTEVFGKKVIASQSVVINRWRKAAMSVEGVTACEPQPTYDKDGRIIGGVITATTINGTNVQIEV